MMDKKKNPFKVNFQRWDFKLAKKNCWHCCGRGWIGTDENDQKVVCGCVIKAQRKLDAEAKRRKYAGN